MAAADRNQDFRVLVIGAGAFYGRPHRQWNEVDNPYQALSAC